ncbi:MAG: type IV pilus modification protein PilV [Thiogranum sp.]
MPLKQNLARNRSRGFTLIEVLVSMIILAVGLLGIAGLQTMGLRNNQSALLRSQATLCAYDMSDRMRTNSQGFYADNYDEPASTAVTNCESTTGCSPSEMATNDMSAWSTVLSNTLPAGAGIVCLDSTPDDGDSNASPACDGTGSTYAIKIWWQDDRGNPGTLQRFVVSYL